MDRSGLRAGRARAVDGVPAVGPSRGSLTYASPEATTRARCGRRPRRPSPSRDSLQDPCWEGLAAKTIGLTHQAEGEHEGALEWMKNAGTLCRRVTDSYIWIEVDAFLAEAQAALEVGDTDRAEAVADGPSRLPQREAWTGLWTVPCTCSTPQRDPRPDRQRALGSNEALSGRS